MVTVILWAAAVLGAPAAEADAAKADAAKARAAIAVARAKGAACPCGPGCACPPGACPGCAARADPKPAAKPGAEVVYREVWRADARGRLVRELVPCPDGRCPK